MARWRNNQDPFPAPLREFREEDWPPVAGECLEHYTCHGEGHGRPCVPRPGEYCGQLCYEAVERGHPDQLAKVKRSDAYKRYSQARLNWLGEDHPAWFEEWLDAIGVECRIRRYGR